MAVGPLARILAQIVVPVIAVLARTIPAAYGQALRNARKGGIDATEAAAPVFGKKISRSEALQVLNLAEAEATPEAVQKVSEYATIDVVVRSFLFGNVLNQAKWCIRCLFGSGLEWLHLH